MTNEKAARSAVALLSSLLDDVTNIYPTVDWSDEAAVLDECEALLAQGKFTEAESLASYTTSEVELPDDDME